MLHNTFQLTLLFVFYLNVLKSQYLWQVYDDKIVKWNYYDGDEFNKGFINSDKWYTNLPWSHAVVSQDIYYLDSNITFDRGLIKFSIKKEDSYFPLNDWEMDTIQFKKKKIALKDKNKFPFKWTGGLVYSKKEYKYGYFEIKFKAPEGQGIWPAFWLYRAKPNNEIDFFELKGEKENQLHVDIHCPQGCGNYKEGWFGYRRGWGHWLNVSEKLKGGFNVISGEWTKDYIKWFLNGELIAYSNHPFDLSMGMTAGTGIAKNGGPFEPGPNKETVFPNYFYVDYIRVYKTDTLPNYKEIKNNMCSKGDNTYETPETNFKAHKKSSSLKNNPDKDVKHDNVITLSINQITQNEISLRVLGVSKGDKINIQLKSGDKTIYNIDVKENIEVLIPILNHKNVSIVSELNGQRIEDNIIIQ